ncbi:MAG: hypothetical protein IKM30_00890 [Oscillospiraceae bacterium]|nr:hypothetical protein [Oscillospiraceae bacterium]
MERFLLRVDTALRVSMHPVEQVTENRLCDLLACDVTERMRAFEVPAAFAEQGIRLCYYIDGRGGERALPANLCATCFYHTGCAVYGDMLLAAVCGDTVRGFSMQEAEQLSAWLKEQMPFLQNDGCSAL